MNRLLTPRQVAHSLGVSESSLKRWCDRADLPFTRTAGGHRKIAIPAVVRFLRENQREIVRPDILGLPSETRRSATILHNSIQVLTEALVRGDVEASRRIVLEFFLTGHTVARICDELLTPALSLIGDRWECGDVEVYEEHRAVELIVRLLHEIRMTIENTGANSLVAMGSSVEGDMCGLPIESSSFTRFAMTCYDLR